MYPTMVLSDTKARSAKPRRKPYKLYDGHGLYLLIHSNGSKYWRLRYRLSDKEKLHAIGVYPEVSLAEAREAATGARKLVKVGRDPVTEQRAAKATAAVRNATTFEGVAKEWIDKRREKWSATYADKVSEILRKDLYPRIGGLPIAEVKAPVLLAALRPIEARGALEVASRARRWSGEIFRYAIATGRAEFDPSIVLKGALKSATTKHYPALQRDEIGDFCRKLTDYTGRPETRLAIRLLMLTFTRPGELRAAKWGEIDMEQREWRIPAERMKGRRPHLVPLSKQAVLVLTELQRFSGYSAWLFPGTGKQPCMSEMTINRAIERLGYGGRVVGHGFRATASTILNESGRYSPDVIERQLAHRERNKVRAAYHRAEYLPQRRTMMQWWADYLDGLTAGGKVVSLKGRVRQKR